MEPNKRGVFLIYREELVRDPGILLGQLEADHGRGSLDFQGLCTNVGGV